MINRRDLLKLTGLAGVSTLLGGKAFAMSSKVDESAVKGKAHVVVIGGGFGGATAAKYIKVFDKDISVTLVEPSTKYYTCPFSNTVIGGFKKLEDIEVDFSKLKDLYGVNIVHQTVVEIDAAGKTVTLDNGKKLKYDKLVVSPGISFNYSAVEGAKPEMAETLPHAWKAGPQTVLLRKQLEAMPDGGTFVMVIPPNPYRCPPGPYERASLVAWYLKNNKPKSKVLLLDAKNEFAKQKLFMEGWQALYGNMVEWVQADLGGKVVKVDPKEKIVYTSSGEKIKGDVINFIPHQKAGELVLKFGLADDKGWAQINPKTFESKNVKDIYVIGDSAATIMPKSGFSANSHGKAAAAAIVASINGKNPEDITIVNICYSLVSPDYGISVAAVYNVNEKGITAVQGAGGVSPAGMDEKFRKKEAIYAQVWYDNIVADTWGKV
ncbi:sulfide dehydrogenase [flavoCytochrome c] flavoprotein chain (fc) (fcsd) (flavocytochrome c flavoprotein subunit) [Sulfurihydrogenibium azorense Az-Fu1]|uniref:Sulfide dehydrogenase [flavoCytochrome c] flavoprotein chain (Fc) (Fcsd) (Flavocytochrome c flavoprotein subunit) n=1 Tax=Sulfurihydrogenibium azorense (strain DSM 15241 / OCM 825 / Az-Fu1) TaxID=204536 RepID=C1DWZ8_SULAA|nr:FCSD flavin-binding domain-containing protein [Sulfurihydrogenibium azorense]ACN98903.1 sulfide dehydrogenase [flavoCytochrome c] flavoprotein chain (fc) (fcsd) (flavocytochrome c flavoprotein subunit) [Sulfurihydrogenibium azorense Az-Fu1]